MHRGLNILATSRHMLCLCSLEPTILCCCTDKYSNQEALYIRHDETMICKTSQISWPRFASQTSSNSAAKAAPADQW